MARDSDRQLGNEQCYYSVKIRFQAKKRELDLVGLHRPHQRCCERGEMGQFREY